MSVSSSPEPLFDTTVLSHFACADRLDVLSDLLAGQSCGTTDVVRKELLNGAQDYPDLGRALDVDWLDVLPLDAPESLTCYARWVRRIGRADRNLGEASVFAVAELHGGTVVTDDFDAVRVGRAHGLDVQEPCGSLPQPVVKAS